MKKFSELKESDRLYCSCDFLDVEIFWEDFGDEGFGMAKFLKVEEFKHYLKTYIECCFQGNIDYLVYDSKEDFLNANKVYIEVFDSSCEITPYGLAEVMELECWYIEDPIDPEFVKATEIINNLLKEDSRNYTTDLEEGQVDYSDLLSEIWDECSKKYEEEKRTREIKIIVRRAIPLHFKGNRFCSLDYINLRNFLELRELLIDIYGIKGILELRSLCDAFQYLDLPKTEEMLECQCKKIIKKLEELKSESACIEPHSIIKIIVRRLILHQIIDAMKYKPECWVKQKDSYYSDVVLRETLKEICGFQDVDMKQIISFFSNGDITERSEEELDRQCEEIVEKIENMNKEEQK